MCKPIENFLKPNIERKKEIRSIRSKRLDHIARINWDMRLFKCSNNFIIETK